jgi:prophage regulatory protein
MSGNESTESRGFYDKSAIVSMTTLSYTTLWRMIRDGKFPPPVQISKGRVAWPKSSVDAWLTAKADSQETAA